MEKEQRVFQIDLADNVATALDAINPGLVTLIGCTRMEHIYGISEIPKGHKIALVERKAGDDIVKYGVIIGKAVTDIKAGEWVHLHNIRSVYDERSRHLDAVTGAPRDVRYE